MKWALQIGVAEALEAAAVDMMERCWKTRNLTEGQERWEGRGLMTKEERRRPSPMARNPYTNVAFRRAIAESPRGWGLTDGVGRVLKTLLLAVGSMQPLPPPVWCNVWVKHGFQASRRNVR